MRVKSFKKSKTLTTLKLDNNINLLKRSSNDNNTLKSVDNNIESGTIFPRKVKIRRIHYNSDKLLNYNNLSPEIVLPKIQDPFSKMFFDIKKKVLKKNLSFFITDQNGIKINKTGNKAINYRKNKRQKKESHMKEYLNFNVFVEKDLEIKDIIDEFNTQIEKHKVNKLQRRKNILNKLYGITPEYNKIIKTSKSQKLLPLEEYQDNLLAALSSNGKYSSDSLSGLYQKFKIIKTDIESVTPYPKINIKNIINHFKNGIKKKNDKMLRLKEFLSKSKEPKDEFEKEEKNIISLKLKKNHNYISKIQHDNLYMLPVHIRKLFIK